MSLSEKSFNAIVDTMAKEAVNEIMTNDEWCAYTYNFVEKLIDKRLGEIDDDLASDLTFAIFERITLTTVPGL